MRKLAIACASFSAAVFAANYLFDIAQLPSLAIILLIAGSAALLLRRKLTIRAGIILLSAAVGFGAFSMHYSNTVEKAHGLDGETTLIRIAANDFSQQGESYVSLDAVLCDENMPRLNMTVYSRDGFLDGIEPGDIVELSAKLSAADIRYDKPTDKYISKDIYLTATAKSEAVKVGERSFSMSAIAMKLRRLVTETVDSVFDERTAPFMKSLMVGDKSDFYDNDRLYIAMSRSGLMHIVAVSGMHVAFIVYFLQLILGKGVKSSVISLVVVWLFVAVSGASPSAVRAGFMLTVCLAAPILKRESDNTTTLLLALAVILAQNPFCASSVSLQLSFAAMAGLLFVSSRMNRAVMNSIASSRAKKLLGKPIGIITGSIGVMIFSMPLMALHFGYVSLLSPISNVLCVWAVPACFAGGYIACVLSIVPILGSIAAFIVKIIANIIFMSAWFTSSADFAVVYMSNKLMVIWMAATYMLILPMCFVRRSPVKKILITAAASAIVLFGANTLVRTYYNSFDGVYTVINVGQGQCISAFSGDKTAVVDCGSNSTGFDNAGEAAAAYLRGCGRKRIDVLFITHLHSDHANGITRLSNLYDIEKIVLTRDADNSDELLEEIKAVADEHEIEIEYITEDETVTVGNIDVRLYAPTEKGTKNERCMMLRLSCDGTDMLITGDAAMAAERSLVKREELEGTEIFVVGHHGSKYSTSEQLLEEMNGDTAIISVGDNSYGHPTDEVLARLEEYGYNVRRTDIDGNVETFIK